MSSTSVRIASVMLAASVLCGSSTLAGSVNEEKGLAIRGFDPVAYFTQGRPVVGLAKYKARHGGATFRFATAANRDSFVARPERWAPAYGGFCAYGTSQGYKAAIHPAAFTIVEGRLYLNYNAEVKKKWSEDVPGYIEKADRNWPTVAKTEKVFR